MVLDTEYMRCESWVSYTAQPCRRLHPSPIQPSSHPLTQLSAVCVCATIIQGPIFEMIGGRHRGLKSLCISDVAKQMLLNCDGFVPHLLFGLLLDPEHPRKDTDESIKAVVQLDFIESIQQISLFPPGWAALKTAGDDVQQALTNLKDNAFTQEAKQLAEATLLVLNPPVVHRRQSVVVSSVDAAQTDGHIMLSCEWCMHSSMYVQLCFLCAIDSAVLPPPPPPPGVHRPMG